MYINDNLFIQKNILGYQIDHVHGSGDSNAKFVLPFFDIFGFAGCVSQLDRNSKVSGVAELKSIRCKSKIYKRVILEQNLNLLFFEQ